MNIRRSRFYTPVHDMVSQTEIICLGINNRGRRREKCPRWFPLLAARSSFSCGFSFSLSCIFLPWLPAPMLPTDSKPMSGRGFASQLQTAAQAKSKRWLPLLVALFARRSLAVLSWSSCSCLLSFRALASRPDASN